MNAPTRLAEVALLNDAYSGHARPGAGLHVGSGVDCRRGPLLSCLQLNAHPASTAPVALVDVGSDRHLDASSEMRAFLAEQGSERS